MVNTGALDRAALDLVVGDNAGASDAAAQAGGSTAESSANTASPASLAGTTVQVGSAGGLVFDINFDSSVGSAPAGFTSAIMDAVAYYESVFTDPVTVTIDVGWGEIGGSPLSAGSLGESETYLDSFSYGQLKAALAADAKTAEAQTAVASLPATNPTGSGTFAISTAEAKALGLIANNTSVDGYVGFGSAQAYTFDPNNRAVSGAFDFIGVAEHEISEVMGRIALLGDSLGSSSANYSALDLFRYSSPGVRQLVAGQPAYLSLDGGATNLDNFNTLASGDAGDWASSAGNDSYDAFANPGVANLVTSSDLSAMDILGWSLSAANPPAPSPTPTPAPPPTVSPDGSTLFPGSGGSLTTSAGIWTFSTALDVGGNDILLNGRVVGSGDELEVAKGGNMYADTVTGVWYEWSGYWSVSSNPNPGGPAPPPTPAPSPPPTLSPDGSTLFPGSGGTLTTSAGSWTFSTALDVGGNDILLNGKTVGAGTELEVANGGNMYADTVRGNWYEWSGNWNLSSNPNSASALPALASTGGDAQSAGPATQPPSESASAIVLSVGPGGQFHTISDAVSFADSDANPNDYYDIQVSPGTYTNDFSTVTRPMTIEAQPGSSGSVVLLATEPPPNEKGIILTTSSLTVDGLTFEGAAISDADGGNGAGIRDQNTGPGASLIVEDSSFVGNQEGILQGYDAGETIQIIDSSFFDNGNPDVDYAQHGIYINLAASLTVTGSVFAGQLIGHDIKSRALSTTVSNSRIYDGAPDPTDGVDAGSTSYGIDLANGGVGSITNNLIIQGAATQNETMVDYGAEGLTYTNNSLLVSGNTFISTGVPHAVGIQDIYGVPVQLLNNTFQGVPTPVNPPSAAVYIGSPPPTASPDGSTLFPGSGGSLMTSAGTWTFSTALDSGGNDILLNGAVVGSGDELEVANQGTMYADTVQGNWFEWTGSGWGPSANPNPPAPVPPPTVSPDGSTLFPVSGGSLTTSAGTWTFSTATDAGGNDILLNGKTVGAAAELEVANGGNMYADTAQGVWYEWSGNWNVSANPNLISASNDPTLLAGGIHV